jgi:flagellar hook-basal body complex protein FliE
MNKRRELEAELATAEANCRRANDAFDKAAADMAKAIVDWNLVATDRLNQGADIGSLSKTVTDRQNAYTAKSNAEAEWGKAESFLHQSELEWEKAQARLDAATAKRDQIVAALDELTALGFGARPSKRSGTWIKRLEEVFRPATTPATYAAQFGEHDARSGNRKSQDVSARRKPIHGFRIGVSTQDPNPQHALAGSALLRQVIGLLCLTLAYLQYYYLDVQLEIMSLPSVTVFPFH